MLETSRTPLPLEAAPVYPLGARPIAQTIPRDHDLPDDLPRGQIAHQALGAGVAECAGQGASDLAGETERAAVGLGNVDALDLVRLSARVPVRQPQQPLARAVDGSLLGHDLRPRQRVMGIELGAQFLRHARHLVEMTGTAHIEPLPELLDAHLALRRRYSDCRKCVGQLGAREPYQRRFAWWDVTLERDLFHESRRREGLG